MFRRIIRAALRYRAELATAAAFLLGWALVTWAIVLFTTPVAWLVSLGVLLISVGGWELLHLVMRKGYTLTRRDQGGE